jgi:hypothetical protein
MSPRIQGGNVPRQTRMIDGATFSPKVAVPTSVLVLIGAVLAVLDSTGVLDLDDSLWIALLSAGGVTGVTGYAARPGAVVTDTRPRAGARTIRRSPMQGETGERGLTLLEALVVLLLVAVIALVFFALT